MTTHSVRLATAQSQPQNSTIPCGHITIGEAKKTHPIQHSSQGFPPLIMHHAPYRTGRTQTEWAEPL